MANSQLNYAPDQDLTVRSMRIAPNSTLRYTNVVEPFFWTVSGSAVTCDISFLKQGNIVTMIVNADCLRSGTNEGSLQMTNAAFTGLLAPFKPVNTSYTAFPVTSSGVSALGVCKTSVVFGLEFQLTVEVGFSLSPSANGALTGSCSWVAA